MFYRGAEAVIYEKKEMDGLGVVSTNIIKERVSKTYRLAQIDVKLRKQRTKSEASLIREAARAGANVPRIIEEKGYKLVLEKIPGKTVKAMLNESNAEEICKKIGMAVALLHQSGIIHGDITTSNMIFSNNEIYMIDFGLGFRSQKPEDMATDLHVLSQALTSSHFSLAEKAWNILLKAYSQNMPKRVITSLKNIEKRGRYMDRSDC